MKHFTYIEWLILVCIVAIIGVLGLSVYDRGKPEVWCSVVARDGTVLFNVNQEELAAKDGTYYILDHGHNSTIRSIWLPNSVSVACGPALRIR